MIKEKIIPVIFKLFQNGRQGKLSNFCYETSDTLMLKQPRKLKGKKIMSVFLMNIDVNIFTKTLAD